MHQRKVETPLVQINIFRDSRELLVKSPTVRIFINPATRVYVSSLLFVLLIQFLVAVTHILYLYSAAVNGPLCVQDAAGHFSA